jgi:hypothetical protein
MPNDKETLVDRLKRWTHPLSTPTISEEDARAQDQVNNEKTKSLVATGVVGLTGGLALTLLTKQLIDLKDSYARNKMDKKVREYAAAKYPVFSPDMSLRDEKEEKRMDEAGTEEEKALPELEQKTAESWVTNVSSDPKALAVGIGGLATGVYFGAILSDKLSAKRRTNQLDTRISKARNELDRLFTQEYLRTRGLKSNVEYKEANFSLKEAGVLDSFTFWFKSLYTLYGAATAFAGYGIGKDYINKRDPNRIRLNDIKELDVKLLLKVLLLLSKILKCTWRKK